MLEYEFPKNINVPLNPRYNSLQVYKERSMHEYVFELRMEVYLRFLIKALEGGKKLCALVFVEIKPLMAIVVSMLFVSKHCAFVQNFKEMYLYLF